MCGKDGLLKYASIYTILRCQMRSIPAKTRVLRIIVVIIKVNVPILDQVHNSHQLFIFRSFGNPLIACDLVWTFNISFAEWSS